MIVKGLYFIKSNLLILETNVHGDIVSHNTYLRLATRTRRRAVTASAASAANAKDTAPSTRSVSAVPFVVVIGLPSD